MRQSKRLKQRACPEPFVFSIGKRDLIHRHSVTFVEKVYLKENTFYWLREHILHHANLLHWVWKLWFYFLFLFLSCTPCQTSCTASETACMSNTLRRAAMCCIEIESWANSPLSCSWHSIATSTPCVIVGLFCSLIGLFCKTNYIATSTPCVTILGSQCPCIFPT